MKTTSTPWGAPQSARQLAVGIVKYSTASHGGIHLTAERIAAMPEALRGIAPWAGPGWYEEDADWSLVALAFPEAFEPSSVYYAVRTIQAGAEAGHYLSPAVVWLASSGSAEARAVRMIAGLWERNNAGLYRIACEGSIPRRHEALAASLQPKLDPYTRHNLGWAVLRRISDGAEAEALLLPGESREPVNLSTIPAERILRQPAA